LHIGTAPNKNLRRHIEALKGIPCMLHIVGHVGPEEQSLLQRYGIAFECTPDLDDTGVVRAYEACDLLLFASTSEGFGMPILEAHRLERARFEVESVIQEWGRRRTQEGQVLIAQVARGELSPEEAALRLLRD
jgi:hypothetical protein